MMAEVRTDADAEHRAVRRVLEVRNPMAETQLNEAQVMTIVTNKMVARALNVPLLSHFIDDFMVAQKSLHRQSIAEFVDALKHKKSELLEKAQKVAWLG